MIDLELGTLDFNAWTTTFAMSFCIISVVSTTLNYINIYILDKHDSRVDLCGILALQESSNKLFWGIIDPDNLREDGCKNRVKFFKSSKTQEVHYLKARGQKNSSLQGLIKQHPVEYWTLMICLYLCIVAAGQNGDR